MRNILWTLFIGFSCISLMGQDAASTNQKYRVDGLSTTQFTEFAPSISANGKTIIFETNRLTQFKWDLYQSYQDEEGNWSSPIALNNINYFGDSSDLIGGPNISYDGNFLYFFASFRGGLGNNDIYYSVREGDGWSDPVNIGAPINTTGAEAFPTLSSDGKTLYFLRESLNVPDFSGDWKPFCFEIYRSRKGRDGKWGEPEKLPYPINLGCEKAPRIMADNKTLIFASSRNGETRKFDLFQSQEGEDGEWAFPIPLDYVNTPEDDQFACISASGELMYFNTLDDIYAVEIPEELRQFKNVTIQGTITDADNKQGLAAQLIVTDANTSEVIAEIDNNPSDGGYAIVLTAGRSYNIEVSSNNYSSYYTSYDLTSLDSYSEYEEDVELFKTVKLLVNIYDSELLDPLPGTVRVLFDDDKQEYRQVSADPETGKALVEVPIGYNFAIAVTADNFSEEWFSLDLRGLILYRDFEKDIEIDPDKVQVQINVTDIKNKGRIRSRVVIRNKSRNEVIEVDGNEMISLRAGDTYEIEATTDKGYAYASTEIDLTNVSGGETASVAAPNVDLSLQPLDKNTILNLKEINFESNSSTLSDISYDELQRVVQLMKSNPTLKVEIGAHTDDIGSLRYNQILSEKRAGSVVEYLIDHDIPEDRFTSRGYGESTPLVTNDSDENRARNRRVELKIVDIDT